MTAKLKTWVAIMVDTAMLPEMVATEDTRSQTLRGLARRISIPLTATSPPGLIEAETVDPWNESGKYGLGWTYFGLALLILVAVTRIYHKWTDKLRQAMHKHEVEKFQQQQFERYYEDVEWQTAPTGNGEIRQSLLPGQQGGGEGCRPGSHQRSIALVVDCFGQ